MFIWEIMTLQTQLTKNIELKIAKKANPDPFQLKSIIMSKIFNFSLLVWIFLTKNIIKENNKKIYIFFYIYEYYMMKANNTCIFNVSQEDKYF